MEANRTPASKKNYHAPKVLVYGQIGEVTESVAGTRGNDGAGGPIARKTS